MPGPAAATSRARRAVGLKLRDRLSIDENDSVLARVPLDFEVMVYFADPPVNLYQIRQWLYPLEQLNASHPVFILTRETGTFQALRQRDRAPDHQRRADRHGGQHLQGERHQACLVCEPDLPQNFSALRYADMLHVYLSHGESEKTAYTASNQAKAYDFAFVAGEAAVARYRDGPGQLRGGCPAAQGRPTTAGCAR